MKPPKSAAFSPPQGTITACDSVFARLHGFASGDEVLGQRLTDLIPSIQLPPPGAPIPKVGAQVEQALLGAPVPTG